MNRSLCFGCAAVAAGIASGTTCGQYTVTSTARHLEMKSSFSMLGEYSGFFHETDTTTGLDFSNTMIADLVDGPASLYTLASQESSFSNGVLTASSRLGIGMNLQASASFADFYVESTAAYEVEVFEPTPFRLNASLFPNGLAPFLLFEGELDSGGSVEVMKLGDFRPPYSQDLEGVLEPGTYTLTVGEYEDAVWGSGGSFPFDETTHWEFELTLVPTPATGALFALGTLATTRRRRR